jgi:hypothetical protein
MAGVQAIASRWRMRDAAGCGNAGRARSGVGAVLARAIIEAWRRHYNEVRPHLSPGYLTPAEFATKVKNHSSRFRNGPGRCATWGFAPGPSGHRP